MRSCCWFERARHGLPGPSCDSVGVPTQLTVRLPDTCRPLRRSYGSGSKRQTPRRKSEACRPGQLGTHASQRNEDTSWTALCLRGAGLRRRARSVFGSTGTWRRPCPGSSRPRRSLCACAQARARWCSSRRTTKGAARGWGRSAAARPVTRTLGRDGQFAAPLLRSDKPVTGYSLYNVTPDKAAFYFNKIQCFCFEEQRLRAGARTRSAGAQQHRCPPTPCGCGHTPPAPSGTCSTH
jgi:hypothetical protein